MLGVVPLLCAQCSEEGAQVGLVAPVLRWIYCVDDWDVYDERGRKPKESIIGIRFLMLRWIC